MTVKEFSQTRFGAGMQVKINKTGEIKDIISVDFETNKIGVAYFDGQEYNDLDDLNWFHCEWVELIEEIPKVISVETYQGVMRSKPVDKNDIVLNYTLNSEDKESLRKPLRDVTTYIDYGGISNSAKNWWLAMGILMIFTFIVYLIKLA